MRTRSPDVELSEPRVQGPLAPHTLFILPELTKARIHERSLLILADGNRRSSAGGGYAGGARRVVSIAEHLARRREVGTMVACILSPDNIAKRGNGFFFELYREFIQLGVDIAARGALVDSGVRLEIWGDLESLRRRGGHAVLLADAIEAVAVMTDAVAEPALRLVLGVGYGPDTARELDVDIVLRTGMEEPGVLRLSGLRTGGRIVNAATATLWPDVEPREVDELLALCPRRDSPRFRRGHGLSAIVDLVVALAKESLDPPLRITIPTSAPRAQITAAMDRLYAGPLRGCDRIAVEHVGASRHGSTGAAPHLLRIVDGLPSARPQGEQELLSVLTPGQRPPSFTLPDWLPLDHANIHACGTTAEALVAGVRAARRFSAANPPLLGRDRARVAEPPVPEAAPRRGLTMDRDEPASRFAERMLDWAGSAGLMLPGAAWKTAALNYALTAFFIHVRIPAEWDPTGGRWEERAELTARYMLLVAAGDEGIFDRVIADEAPPQRGIRLEQSSRFLRQGLARDGSSALPPPIEGRALLVAIADQWRTLEEQYRATCLPAAAASFRAGLEDLYLGSVAEHRAGIGAGPFRGASGAAIDREALSVAVEERFAAAPVCVAERARELAEAISGDHGSAAQDELRALFYLAEVSGAIGAGLLFRAAALSAPAGSVTRSGLAALDAAATLLDYHVRLSNDVSGFLDSPGGDRDDKENACTILVPASASGAERASAIVAALATCKRLAGWLAVEIGSHAARLAAAWPWMGVIFQRGVLVGRRVYEVGHYTTVSRAGMSAIFAEADAALGAAARREARAVDAPFEETVNTEILAWPHRDDLASVPAEP